MLYKTAAYLVILTITLHFTTSEAEVINQKKAKEAVKKLFLGFISIAVEFKSQNLNDLINIANDLVGYIDPKTYLETIAKDEACLMIKDEIDSYVSEFQKLLDEAQNPHQQDLKIPMIEKLAQLRLACASSQGESSSQSSLTRRINMTTSLREILQTKLNDYKKPDEPILDNFGFNIQEGKMKVKIMLGVLLQLAIDNKCINIYPIRQFVQKMLGPQSKLFSVLTDALPQYAGFILIEINAYNQYFSANIPSGSEYLLDTLDAPILRFLRVRCAEVQPLHFSGINSLDQFSAKMTLDD